MTEKTDNEPPAHTNPDTSALQKSIKGQVLTASDSDFEKVALDVWNKYGATKRRPQLIVRVANEQDVVEAVKLRKSQQTESHSARGWTQLVQSFTAQRRHDDRSDQSQ